MVDCFDKIKTQFGDVDPKKIKEIIAAHEKIRNNKDYAFQSKQLRVDTLRQTQDRTKNIIRDAIASRKMANDSFKQSNPHKEFVARAVGLNKAADGSNFNVVKVRESFRNRMDNLVRMAIPDDVRKAIKGGEFDEDIADGMFLLNQGKAIDHLDPLVQKVAKGYKSVNKNLIDSLRDAGVDIRERSDYITRQSHDRLKITNFEEWSNDLLADGVLNKTTTFGGIADFKEQKSILKKIFNQIQKDGLEKSVGTFGGVRSIHFASGKNWAKYNNKYGIGSIHDSIDSTITSSSRAFANSMVFGSQNGRKIWDSTEKRISEKLRLGDDRAAEELWTKGASERNGLKSEVFGYEHHKGWLNFGQMSTVANKIQAAALLSKALKSTVTDLAFSTFNFRSITGDVGIGVELNHIKTFAKMFGSNEHRDKWASRLDMKVNADLADLYNRFGVNVAEDSHQNGISFYKKAGEMFDRASGTVLKATGLARQSAAAKVSNAFEISAKLGQISEDAWADLNPRIKDNLARFNITEKDWPTLQKSVKKYENGVPVIVPEGITGDLGLTSKQTNELRTKLATYLVDSSTIGSPESSAADRLRLFRGTDPNSLIGSSMRTAFQFKTFNLAIPRVVGRITQSKVDAGSFQVAGVNIPTDQGDLALFGGLMVSATVLAATGMAAGNVLNDKETNIQDKDFWMDAFQRGAVPLMVNYMISALRGEYDKNGERLFKDIAGPTFGQVPKVAKLGSETINIVRDIILGKEPPVGEAATTALDLVFRNAPGQNFPMVRPLIEKAFLVQFYEHINPKAANRLKRRDAKKNKLFDFDSILAE